MDEPEYDDYDYYHQPEAKTNCAYVPGHLNVPIYETECEFILDDLNFKFICPRHKKIVKFLKKNNITSSLSKVSADPYNCIEQWVRTTKTAGRNLKKLWRTLDVWAIQKINFMTPSINGNLTTFEEQMEYIRTIRARLEEFQSELQEDFVSMGKVERIKDNICCKETPMGSFLPFEGIYTERDLTIMTCPCHGKTLVSTSLFLAALDKMQSKFPMALYWAVCDATNKYPGFSIYERGRLLFETLKSLRGKMGQDFFSFVAGWESLLVGSIIARKDDVGCTQLYNFQVNEMNTLLKKNNVTFDLNELLCKGTSINETTMMLELIGMSKSFGYPTLEIDRLLDPLKEFGVETMYEIDWLTVQHIDAIAKREFTLNFRSRRGHYPKMKVCPTEFIQFVSRNIPIPKSMMKKYELWGTIVFDKNLEFDFCPDQTELLKDSSTAVNKSAWPTMYDKCAFRKLYNKDYPTSGDKTQDSRTLYAYLNQEDDNFVKRLISDLQQGKPNEENHIAVECGKECELKVGVGRAFTKQTSEQRLIQTCLEHNVASTIFMYLPEQTMIDGEIRNMKRVLEQVSDLQHGDISEQHSEFLCLDLKKWCLFQRHTTNALIGRMYDSLFGLE